MPRFLNALGLLACLLLGAGCASLTPPPAGERIVRDQPYKFASNRTLRLDYYLPSQPGPRPLVFWIHGGGWKYGDKAWMLFVRNLTREGYVVSSVEYRLSGRALWPAQYEDCRDALNFTLAHARDYRIDPRNVFVAGASAGAHLAALLGERAGRSRVNAEFLMYPPTDLTGFTMWNSATKGYLPSLLGGSVNNHWQEAIAASPVTDVTPQSPPVLIMHGDRDLLVPIKQSRELVARLHAAGVASTLVVLPGAKHGFSLTPPELEMVHQFFQRHLRRR